MHTNWKRLILLNLNTFVCLCIVFSVCKAFEMKISEMYDSTALGNHLKAVLVVSFGFPQWCWTSELLGYYWNKSQLSTDFWDSEWSPLIFSECTTACYCIRGGGLEGWWYVYKTKLFKYKLKSSCFLDTSFMIKARIPISFHFLPMTINCLKMFVWLDFVVSFA